VIPEYGCVGMALAGDHVQWVVDTTRREGVRAIGDAHLRASLFHELHHLARGWTSSAGTWAGIPLLARAGRTRPPKPWPDGEGVLNAIVSEGLATAFERDSAGHRALWGLYPLNVRDWVAELLTLPADAMYSEWMFDHSDGRRWVGYRAGTYLADRAIAASGRSAAELVTTPADEILALALPAC